jgi:hypothetical protein
MDRNPITASIARRVSRAIDELGLSVQSVAHAADITTPDLLDRLQGRVEFPVDELVRVGGVLRVPVAQFVEAA